MILPDRIGSSARRLAAKMIADQSVELMTSMVCLHGSVEDPIVDDDTAFVLVARGRAMARIIRMLNENDVRARFVEQVPDDQ